MGAHHGRLSHIAELNEDDIEYVPGPNGQPRELGKGGMGVVYLARYKGTFVAVKKIIEALIAEDSPEAQKYRDEFISEMQLLQELNHPHILGLVGGSEKNHILVTEYMSKGDLYSLISRRVDAIRWDKRGATIARDVARAVAALHEKRVVHRDLKSPNILIGDNYVAKVADVGIAKRISPEASRLKVEDRQFSLLWAAPEMLVSDELDEKADVYSLGVIIWELYTQRSPWNDIGMQYKINELVVAGEHNTIPEDMPPTLRQLLLGCWMLSPADRPSAAQVADKLDAILEDSQRELTERMTRSGLSVIESSIETVNIYRKAVNDLVENARKLLQAGADPVLFKSQDQWLALLVEHVEPLSRLPETCSLWENAESAERWVSLLLDLSTALVASGRRARAQFLLNIAETFISRFSLHEKEKEHAKMSGTLLLAKVEDALPLAPAFQHEPLPPDQLRIAVEKLHISRSKVAPDNAAELHEIDCSLLEAEASFLFDMSYAQLVDRIRAQKEPLSDVLLCVNRLVNKMLAAGKPEPVWTLLTNCMRQLRELGRLDDKILLLLRAVSNAIIYNKKHVRDVAFAEWPRYRYQVAVARSALQELVSSGGRTPDELRNATKDYANHIRALLIEMVKDAESFLGPCPTKYCLFLLGSYAGGDPMPYSNVKCGLLVSDQDAADWDSTFNVLTSTIPTALGVSINSAACLFSGANSCHAGNPATAIYMASLYRIFEFKMASLGETEGLRINLALNPRKEARLRGTPEFIFQANKPPAVPVDDPLLYSFMCGISPLYATDDGLLIERLQTLLFSAFTSPIETAKSSASSSSSPVPVSAVAVDQIAQRARIIPAIGSNPSLQGVLPRESLLLQRQVAMVQLEQHVIDIERRMSQRSSCCDVDETSSSLDLRKRLFVPLKFGVILLAQYNFLLPETFAAAQKANSEKYGFMIRAFADLCDNAAVRIQQLRIRKQLTERLTGKFELTEEDREDMEMFDWAVLRPIVFGLRRLISSGEFPEDPANIMLQEKIQEILPHMDDIEAAMQLIPASASSVQSFVFSRAGMKEPVRSYKDAYMKLPEPLRFKFVGFFRSVPKRYVPPNANQVWTAVYNVPSENGDRPIATKLSIEWKDQLSRLFAANPTAKFQVKVAGERNQIKTFPTSIEQQLFPDPNVLRMKSTEERGRHTVHKLEYEGTSVHLKENPEWQIMEYAVSRLYELVIGPDCTPQTSMWAVRHVASAEDDWIPVGVSQTVSGPTLQNELVQTPQGISNLDKKNFSQHVIMSLLVNPEDGKSDNFIVTAGQDATGRPNKRLVSIDNDHAFVPALVSRGLRTTVLVKTILFCFDEMKEPVHPDVAEDILQLSPLSVLKTWLADLRTRDKEYCEMFSEKRIQKLFSEPKEEDRVIISMYARFGLVEELFQKLRKLQDLLRANRKIAHTELLQSLEPQLADFYFDVLRVQCPPADRFKALVRREYRGEMVAGAGTTKTTVSRTLQSVAGRLATEEQVKEHRFDAGVVKCIDLVLELQAKQAQLETIRDQLIKEDKVTSFANLKPECMQQAVVDLIPFSALPTAILKKVLKRIAGRDYTSLKLANLGDIEWKSLHPVIASTKSIQFLDLSGCLNVGTAQVETISKTCPRLGTLALRNLPQLTALVGTRLGFGKVPLVFPTLRHLWISNCVNLYEYDIEAPRLSDIDYEGCVKLLMKKRTNEDIHEARLETNQSFVGSLFKSPLTRIRMEDGSTAHISIMRASTELNTGEEEMMYNINNKRQQDAKEEITAVAFFEPAHFVISGDRKGDIVWWNYESSEMVHKESLGLSIRSLTVHENSLIITTAPINSSDGDEGSTSSSTSSGTGGTLERANSAPEMEKESAGRSISPPVEARRIAQSQSHAVAAPSSSSTNMNTTTRRPPGPVYICTATPPTKPPAPLDVTVTCLHAKNNMLACGLGDGGVLLWDLRQNCRIREIFAEDEVEKTENKFSAVLLAGTYVIAARNLVIGASKIKRPVVKIWSTTENRCVATLGVLDESSSSSDPPASASVGASVALSQNNASIGGGSGGGGGRSIYQWKISSLITVNDYLFTSSWDGKVVVWNLKNFSLVRELLVSHHPMMSLAVQRDMLVAACADGSLRLFPVRDLVKVNLPCAEVPMRTFFAHMGIKKQNQHVWRSSLATTADLIATGGQEGHVKVWRIRPPETKRRAPIRSPL